MIDFLTDSMITKNTELTAQPVNSADPKGRAAD
jgi:hypothetical protein